MSVWFVSRHAGACEWARQQALAIDHWVTHLEPAAVHAGDVVIGTLPVNLIAAICARQAYYLHLTLNLTAQQRGAELSAEHMGLAQARLEAYYARACPNSMQAITQKINN